MEEGREGSTEEELEGERGERKGEWQFVSTLLIETPKIIYFKSKSKNPNCREEI